jgi:hypothetical protein
MKIQKSNRITGNIYIGFIFLLIAGTVWLYFLSNIGINLLLNQSFIAAAAVGMILVFAIFSLFLKKYVDLFGLIVFFVPLSSMALLHMIFGGKSARTFISLELPIVLCLTFLFPVIYLLPITRLKGKIQNIFPYLFVVSEILVLLLTHLLLPVIGD